MYIYIYIYIYMQIFRLQGAIYFPNIYISKVFELATTVIEQYIFLTYIFSRFGQEKMIWSII